VNANAIQEKEQLAAWVVVQKDLFQIKLRQKWNSAEKLAAIAGQAANV